MGPPKANRSISQQAFDEMVKENIDDLGMDPTEALEDAIQTLTLQGVDLSGIVTCVPGEGSVNENPVVRSLERLKELSDDLSGSSRNENDLEEILELLNKLNDLCSVKGSGNAAVATKNGGIGLLCSICPKFRNGCDRALISALNALGSMLYDLQSTEIFRGCSGPKIVLDILQEGSQSDGILDRCFFLVAAAATGNEVLKESFMDLGLDDLIIRISREHNMQNIPCLFDAIRVLLTSDDNRVVASQVYGYARRFAKSGIIPPLVDSLREGVSSPGLVSASVVLKAVSVNDEICRLVAENGGIDAILACIDDSGEQRNKVEARACCALLSKLAGSDMNKNAIIEKGGLDKLIKLSARFSDDSSVLHEVMSIISVLCLRSPDNAARAIEAGAGDLAMQAMRRFPESEQLQRSSCYVIRNLVVRNPENRTLLLENGAERLIRKAKMNHKGCKAAATDALRDLKVDDYNS